MKTKTIDVIVGDIGGAKEVLPAVAELQKRGFAARWFVDPSPKAKAGSEVLAKKGIEFITAAEPLPGSAPDLILIGTSATAVAAQIAWTEYGHEQKIPVVWVEDLWGTGEHESTRSAAPNYMCVSDGMAAQVAHSVRANLPTFVCGKPTFAMELAPLLARKKKIRQNIRKALNVGEDEFLLTFFSIGENSARVEAHLRALVVINEIGGRPFVFAPRLHPKLTSELDRLQKLAESAETKVVDARKLPAHEVTIASSVTINDYGSNSQYASALAGVPAIVTMFPECRDILRAKGFPGGQTPLILANAGWEVLNVTGLNSRLEQIRLDEDSARMFTEKGAEVFRPLLDLGAAGKIADAVEEVFKRWYHY